MFIPKFPLHVVFILSNRCNLACTHCSSNADDKGILGYTTSQAKEIVNQMADLGVVDVAYSGGEPLLRKDLPGLVSHARSLGLMVGTSTNGYPLTEKTAKRLKGAGLSRLQVSLDGTRSMHESIRGPGSFGKAITAVKRSLKQGIKTHICFTAMRSNAHLLPDMLSLARELGVDGFNLSQFVPTGRGTFDQGLTPQMAHMLLQTWLKHKQKYPDMYLAAHSSGLASLVPDCSDSHGGCQAGISIACITAQGDVTPCVMFPLKIGNVHQSDLRTIWSESHTIAKLHKRSLSGTCGNCLYRLECGGCRAAAWAVHGDMMADDPYCWLVDTKTSDTNQTRASNLCPISSSTALD